LDRYKKILILSKLDKGTNYFNYLINKSTDEKLSRSFSDLGTKMIRLMTECI